MVLVRLQHIIRVGLGQCTVALLHLVILLRALALRTVELLQAVRVRAELSRADRIVAVANLLRTKTRTRKSSPVSRSEMA